MGLYDRTDGYGELQVKRRNFIGTLLGAVVGAAFVKLPEIPYPATSVQLMGYRGYQYMEAGFIHVPHIPLKMLDVSR